ncbi:MAG: uracil phosphoribosyltransferase [Marinifilaceae bacterium]
MELNFIVSIQFTYFAIANLKNNMMVHVVDDNNSLLNSFIAELRDQEVHQDSMRFRRNLERVAEVMSYEISKQFSYKAITVQTPINPATVMVPEREVVIASVMRAGLPFHQGFLNYFDKAGNAFISARREYNEDHSSFEIRYDSIYTPSLEGKYLILVDPMLATGASLAVAYKELIKQGGMPEKTFIAAVIASNDGLAYLKEELKDHNITIWVGTLDEKLTNKKYIDPGIGDAGDLAYGAKL